MELQPEWNEFLALQLRHGVRFVMVGGLAVAVHGHERYTKNLDVLVDTSAANAKRLGRALAEFGFAAAGRAWRQLTEPYRILTLGREPLRIDVLTGISGVDFKSVWAARELVETTVGKIPTIGLEQLRRNKLATGRPEDLADVAKLDAIAALQAKRATRAAARSRSTRRRPAATRTRTPGTRRR